MNTTDNSEVKNLTTHCYWPADGWVIALNGEEVARIPPQVSPDLDGIALFVDALDEVTNTDDDLSPDVPDELRAYVAKTPLGYRIHNGLGALIAHVELDVPDAERKAALVARAVDSLWCDPQGLSDEDEDKEGAVNLNGN